MRHHSAHLPPLPPRNNMMTDRVLTAFTAATRSLAELKGFTGHMPDPVALNTLLPLMEARASCEIENIAATNEQLFRAAFNALPKPTPEVKEALRYRAALRTGHQHVTAHGFGTQTALTIVSNILGHEVTIRSGTGTFIGNPRTRERIYTPPQGKDTIENHLSLWETFMNTPDRIDPLIAMAFGHYQFEAIHPFADGNGRIGRILNSLYLSHCGLLRLPVLYLSGYITRRKTEYYAGLRGVTENGDWESWLVYMLNAVDATSRWTMKLIEEVERHRLTTEATIRHHHPRWPVADLGHLLDARPYIRIGDIVNAQLAQRQAATCWLEELCAMGILREERHGRNRIFVNQGLLDVFLDAERVW